MTIFADKQQAVGGFRDRFAESPMLAWLRKCTRDETIYNKLLVGESEVSERLRVFLEPTQVLCADDDNTAAIAALNGAPYYEEPGYDYTPDFFQGNSWGAFKVRRPPIINIQSMRFVYLNATEATFIVPPHWLRPDKRYGLIRLLPTGESAALPLNAYLLSVFGGGRTIPNMIRLTYTSGIVDLAKTNPALYDFVYRVAAFNIIKDMFPSGSSSISVDGLSETESFDIKDYGDKNTGMIEQEYARWQTRLHGVRVMIA